MGDATFFQLMVISCWTISNLLLWAFLCMHYSDRGKRNKVEYMVEGFKRSHCSWNGETETSKEELEELRNYFYTTTLNKKD